MVKTVGYFAANVAVNIGGTNRAATEDFRAEHPEFEVEPDENRLDDLLSSHAHSLAKAWAAGNSQLFVTAGKIMMSAVGATP